jgi:hypothetical protein
MLPIVLALLVGAAATVFCQEVVPVMFPLEIKGAAAVRERLRLDLAAARQSLAAATLDAAVRADLQARADGLAGDIEALPDALPPRFRAIMPFSDLQERLYALQAPVLRAQGFPALTVWQQNRWDPLFPTSAPAAPSPPPALAVALARGEHRGEAFCLTNASDQPLAVTLRVEGLPGGADPAWVGVREVLFTDTYIHYPIAAALPPAPHTAAGYALAVPAGMTRQVWLDLHPVGVDAGTHQGRVVVTAAGLAPVVVPLRIKVYPLDLPVAPSIAIGGWDYTHLETTARDGGVVKQSEFIAFLRGYGVNTPWGGGLATGAEFDAEGHLTNAPDFSAWDAWVAKWPGARYYATFGLCPELAGPVPGSPAFQRRLSDWLGALVAHLGAQGIRPEQLAVLAVDEPRGPDFDAQFVPWGQALRATGLGVTVWEDPCHDDPATADPRLYALSDVLSPSAARFVGSPPSYRDFFVAQQQAGKELWFYSCVNGKHLDPIIYHRGQFWLAAYYGAKGSCYWSFGDEGGAGSSFAAYTSPGHMFSPLFLDPELGLITGKHLEAIREGAEDYELFALLRQRLAALAISGVETPAVAAARMLLHDGPRRGTAAIVLDNLDWRVPKDRGVMDQVRLEVMDALVALADP